MIMDNYAVPVLVAITRAHHVCLCVFVAFIRAHEVLIRYIEGAKASIVISVQSSHIDVKINCSWKV